MQLQLQLRPPATQAIAVLTTIRSDGGKKEKEGRGKTVIKRRRKERKGEESGIIKERKEEIKNKN